MAVTISDLPDLSSGYALTEESINYYKENGHVLLRGVCSADEVAPYREVIVSAVKNHNHEARPIEQRDTYGKAFLQTMNLWTVDGNVKRFTLASRFAKIAASLMGVESVRLYHDQALFKEAGGGHTPWHQDFFYWPLDTSKTVTLWMPLVDATSEMGTLKFASGSHKAGYLGPLEISDASEQYFDDLVKKMGFPLFESGDMKAGDVSFHAGTTLHNAPANRSTTNREVMTIIYFADGTRIAEPDNPNRESDLKTWLPGQKPGDLAASMLNPVIK